MSMQSLFSSFYSNTVYAKGVLNNPKCVPRYELIKQDKNKQEGKNKKTGRVQVFPLFVETNMYLHPLKNTKSQKE